LQSDLGIQTRYGLGVRPREGGCLCAFFAVALHVSEGVLLCPPAQQRQEQPVPNLFELRQRGRRVEAHRVALDLELDSVHHPVPVHVSRSEVAPELGSPPAVHQHGVAVAWVERVETGRRGGRGLRLRVLVAKLDAHLSDIKEIHLLVWVQDTVEQPPFIPLREVDSFHVGVVTAMAR